MTTSNRATAHDPDAAACRCFRCRRARWRARAGDLTGRERLDLCGVCGLARGEVGPGEVDRYHPACAARDRAVMAEQAAAMRVGRRGDW